MEENFGLRQAAAELVAAILEDLGKQQILSQQVVLIAGGDLFTAILQMLM